MNGDQAIQRPGHNNRDCPATARANIAAQIAGLISDSTVMMA